MKNRTKARLLIAIKAISIPICLLAISVNATAVEIGQSKVGDCITIDDINYICVDPNDLYYQYADNRNYLFDETGERAYDSETALHNSYFYVDTDGDMELDLMLPMITNFNSLTMYVTDKGQDYKVVNNWTWYEYVPQGEQLNDWASLQYQMLIDTTTVEVKSVGQTTIKDSEGNVEYFDLVFAGNEGWIRMPSAFPTGLCFYVEFSGKYTSSGEYYTRGDTFSLSLTIPYKINTDILWGENALTLLSSTHEVQMGSDVTIKLSTKKALIPEEEREYAINGAASDPLQEEGVEYENIQGGQKTLWRAFEYYGGTTSDSVSRGFTTTTKNSFTTNFAKICEDYGLDISTTFKDQKEKASQKIHANWAINSTNFGIKPENTYDFQPDDPNTVFPFWAWPNKFCKIEVIYRAYMEYRKITIPFETTYPNYIEIKNWWYKTNLPLDQIYNNPEKGSWTVFKEETSGKGYNIKGYPTLEIATTSPEITAYGWSSNMFFEFITIEELAKLYEFDRPAQGRTTTIKFTIETEIRMYIDYENAPDEIKKEYTEAINNMHNGTVERLDGTEGGGAGYGASSKYDPAKGTQSIVEALADGATQSLLNVILSNDISRTYLGITLTCVAIGVILWWVI